MSRHRLDKGKPGEFCFSSSAASLLSSGVAGIVPAVLVTGQGGLLQAAGSGMKLGLHLPHLCDLPRPPWPVYKGGGCRGGSFLISLPVSQVRKPGLWGVVAWAWPFG